ncbi:MAG: imidazolonepropionase, partial [Synergistetes bacterium]|nr:imidazolonepropionase [Synergistota bacterium]
MDLLVKHAYLVTVADKYKRAKVSREMSDLDIIEDGAFTVKDGYIVDVGTTDELLSKYEETGFKEVVDVGGRAVLPGFVDPHTHAVFIGSREDEFQMRLEGKSYMEILQAGGGILRSVDAVRNASEEELFDALKKRVNVFLEWGTTTVEIKSGYGLSVKDELKQLEVANRCRKGCEVDVVPTFLGAHAVPREYRGKNEEYIKLIIDEMLPEVSRKKLAVFCDVFCERGVFSIEESRLILNRAKELGFLLKLHADEIEAFGGAELAAEVGAVSADH